MAILSPSPAVTLKLTSTAIVTAPALIQTNLTALATQLSHSAATQATQSQTAAGALTPELLKEAQTSSPELASQLAALQKTIAAQAAANQAVLAQYTQIQEQAQSDWASLALKFPSLAATAPSP